MTSYNNTALDMVTVVVVKGDFPYLSSTDDAITKEKAIPNASCVSV